MGIAGFATHPDAHFVTRGSRCLIKDTVYPKLQNEIILLELVFSGCRKVIILATISMWNSFLRA